MEFPYLLDRFKGLISSWTSKEETDIYALIRWSDHFNVSFVSRIKKENLNWDQLNEEESEYIPYGQINALHGYKDKEYFLVCENDGLAGMFSNVCDKGVYHVVQIMANSFPGFNVLDSAVRKLPRDQNRLV